MSHWVLIKVISELPIKQIDSKNVPFLLHYFTHPHTTIPSAYETKRSLSVSVPRTRSAGICRPNSQCGDSAGSRFRTPSIHISENPLCPDGQIVNRMAQLTNEIPKTTTLGGHMSAEKHPPQPEVIDDFNNSLIAHSQLFNHLHANNALVSGHQLNHSKQSQPLHNLPTSSHNHPNLQLAPLPSQGHQQSMAATLATASGHTSSFIHAHRTLLGHDASTVCQHGIEKQLHNHLMNASYHGACQACLAASAQHSICTSRDSLYTAAVATPGQTDRPLIGVNVPPSLSCCAGVSEMNALGNLGTNHGIGSIERRRSTCVHHPTPLVYPTAHAQTMSQQPSFSPSCHHSAHASGQASCAHSQERSGQPSRQPSAQSVRSASRSAQPSVRSFHSQHSSNTLTVGPRQDRLFSVGPTFHIQFKQPSSFGWANRTLLERRLLVSCAGGFFLFLLLLFSSHHWRSGEFVTKT